jgi:hypothetical protein
MADIFSDRADRKADKAMEGVIEEGERVFKQLPDPRNPASRQQARAVLFHALGGVFANEREFKSDATREELVKRFDAKLAKHSLFSFGAEDQFPTYHGYKNKDGDWLYGPRPNDAHSSDRNEVQQKADQSKFAAGSNGPFRKLSGHNQGLEQGPAIILAIGANSRQILKTDKQREAYSTITERIPPERLQHVLGTACSIAPQTEQKDLACQLGGH